MNKFKLFVENFLVYGLGGIISKVIPLIMLPIITRLMPDSFYFGLSDLSNTVVQFGSALAVMGMYDAVFRLFFDKEDEEYQRKVCSTALLFTLCTSFLVFLLLVIFRGPVSEFVFSDRKYANILFLSAISIFIGGTNNIVQIPTRVQNKRKVYLILNTVGPVLSYAVSVPLLINGYYEIALPLAAVISALWLEICFWFLNHKWFDFHIFDKSILGQLLRIGVPLLPNFLIYWVFNSCDRLMIGKLIGNSFTGIYGVGARIASVSQLIYTAFAGGWQYFAFSTMRESDQVKSNSRIFEYLGTISFGCSLLVCAFAYPVFQLLFPGEYEAGFIVVPYLFLAPLMQMLYQVVCNQFLIIKCTWPNMLILGIGALLNVVLNLTLIPLIGIEGAAISTLLGYSLSVLIAVIWLNRLKLVDLDRRFGIVTILTIVYYVVWRLCTINLFWISLLLAILFIGIYISRYWPDIKLLIKKEGHDESNSI